MASHSVIRVDFQVIVVAIPCVSLETQAAHTVDRAFPKPWTARCVQYPDAAQPQAALRRDSKPITLQGRAGDAAFVRWGSRWSPPRSTDHQPHPSRAGTPGS
jgi:hypothetical protein